MTNNFPTLGYQAGSACEVIADDDQVFENFDCLNPHCIYGKRVQSIDPKKWAASPTKKKVKITLQCLLVWNHSQTCPNIGEYPNQEMGTLAKPRTWSVVHELGLKF